MGFNLLNVIMGKSLTVQYNVIKLNRCSFCQLILKIVVILNRISSSIIRNSSPCGDDGWTGHSKKTGGVPKVSWPLGISALRRIIRVVLPTALLLTVVAFQSLLEAPAVRPGLRSGQRTIWTGELNIQNFSVTETLLEVLTEETKVKLTKKKICYDCEDY